MNAQEIFFKDDGEQRIAVWWFPDENCYRVYLQNVHYDTIYRKDTIIEALPLLPRFDMKKEAGEV